jgi:hypothetical protein
VNSEVLVQESAVKLCSRQFNSVEDFTVFGECCNWLCVKDPINRF